MSSSTEIGDFALLNEPDQRSILGLPAIAGLATSLIAAFAICRLPDSKMPSVPALAARAVAYVLITTLSGMVGVRFYWNRSSADFRPNHPISFGPFILLNASAWVWVPAIVLSSREDSLSSLVLAVVGSSILAVGMREIVSQPSCSDHSLSLDQESGNGELFTQSLRTPPREAHAYVIAICVYSAAYALHGGHTVEASGLLALCSFICAWKLTIAPFPYPHSTEIVARAASRFTGNALTAVLITLYALFSGVGKREQANAALAIGTGQYHNDDSQKKHEYQYSASGISGYESIILWPNPPRKEIVAPVPVAISPFEKRGIKRMAIRFDGAYWYFQPPDMRPGHRAHHADGNPLTLDIRVNNFAPLNMEAHQSLGTAIPLKHCGEIQVSIANRDNQPGVISLAVVLSDSKSPKSSPLYLGQQPLMTSEPGRFSIKNAPAEELLRFTIPKQSTIRKFDQITVIFLPDAEHFEVGPKIAIQEFNLLPR